MMVDSWSLPQHSERSHCPQCPTSYTSDNQTRWAVVSQERACAQLQLGDKGLQDLGLRRDRKRVIGVK